MVDSKKYRIAQVGSFDVENYGDILFYDIFSSKIKEYLPSVEVIPFAPIGGNRPFDERVNVYPFRDFEKIHSEEPFDSIVIGGGDIIRLDESVLSDDSSYDDYGKTLDLWALPIMAGIKYDIPVMFNTPGVPKIFSKSQELLVSALLQQVAYLSVRESLSRDKLLKADPTLVIQVVPDTIMAATDVFDLAYRDNIYATLKEEFGLPDEFVIYQQLGRFDNGISVQETGELLQQLEKWEKCPVILMPIGYIQNDLEVLEKIDGENPERFLFLNKRKLSPIEMFTIIGHAKCFVGTSFHGCITAHIQGVPAIGIDCANRDKMRGYFSDLHCSDCYCRSLREVKAEMLSKTIDATVMNRVREKLDQHFSKIAQITEQGYVNKNSNLSTEAKILSCAQYRKDDYGVIDSLIFFDCGKGLSNDRYLEIHSNTRSISFQMTLPENAKQFLFYILDGEYCVLSSLKIQAGLKELDYQVVDGYRIGDFIIYNTIHPLISVMIPEGCDQEISISANVFLLRDQQERLFAGMAEKSDNERKTLSQQKHLLEIERDELRQVKGEYEKQTLELDELMKKNSRLKEQNEAISRINADIKTRFEQQQNIVLLADRKADRLHREKEKLLAENSDLRLKCQEIHVEKDKFQEALNGYVALHGELNRRVQDAEALCQQYVNSTSWKITAPIRKGKDFLLGLRKRGSVSLESASQNPIENDEENTILETGRGDVVNRKTGDKSKSKAYYVPESVINEREPVDQLIERLEKYDVISFDIFDTLIFRLFSEPTTLFRMMALDMGIENFESLRIDAEAEARKMHPEKNGEINIYDIYERLHDYLGIDVENGVQREMEYEKAACFANPYMLKVYTELLRKEKTVVLVSDMYIPAKLLTELLHSCGYYNWSKLYVSNEYHVGKGDGKLQKIVMDEFSDETKFIHLGDNINSDIEGSKKVSWNTYYYENCNKRGEPFRPEKFSSIAGSLYKGIVNTRLYSGIETYNEAYEHGFLYAGLLVCGFCQWLNQYARDRKIEKILFLARDADIISKVYNQYYNQFDNEYVVVSRLAVWKLVFAQQTEEFIKYFILSQAQKENCSIAQAFQENDLSELTEVFETEGFDSEEVLTLKNYPTVRKFIYRHRDLIESSFSNSLEAGIQYWRKVLGDAKKVCVVDLGRSAQILIYLKQFIKTYIDNDITITGEYMAATANTQTNSYIESGLLDTYLFSYGKNGNIMFRNDTPAGHTIATLLEAMFTSTQNTLVEYCLDEHGKISFKYGYESKNKISVEEMQAGIMDFAESYANKAKVFTEGLQLTAVDAFAPFNKIKDDFLYHNKLFGKNMEYSGVPRYNGAREVTSIEQIMRQRQLI